jgi:hypothetical protein
MDKKLDDGGPAFPRVVTEDWRERQDGGMTLRDYFAGQAMQALITKTPVGSAPPGITNRNKATAVGAYDYADAMLRARKETPNG